MNGTVGFPSKATLPRSELMSRTRTLFTFTALTCLLAAPSALATATAQTRAAASTFPLGTFETIISAQDVRAAGFPANDAHYETLTFRSNGTWRDVWFHPRRTDQEPFGGRFTVKGNVLRLLPTPDTLRWSSSHSLLTLHPLAVPDKFARFVYSAHPWKKIK
jgi:hypothetical protein